MNRFTLFAAAILFGAVLATPARGGVGIAGWPLPVLVAGKKTLHVYSVSGVNGGGGGLLGVTT